MKKYFLPAVSLILILSIFCSCSLWTPRQTDPVETPTDTLAGNPADSASENGSESESGSDSDFSWTEAQIRDYIYQNTEETPLEVVAWGITPHRELYAENFKLLMDAGINTVLITEEYYGDGNLFEILEVAEETGMRAYVNASGDNGKAIAYKLQWFLDCPSLVGIYLKDEPLPSQFPSLRDAVDQLYERLPEAKQWQIGANLFPALAYGGGDSSYRVVRNYVNTVDPTFLCWDFYPFSSRTPGPSRFPVYLANMLQMKRIALDADIPLYTFIQTSRINRQEEPSVEQLRLLINSALALGSESLFLFVVGQVGADVEYTGNGETFSYLISSDCTELTGAYYRLAEVLHGVEAMKGVYLNYELSFVQFYNMPDTVALLDEYHAAALVAGSYREYQGITVSDPEKSAIVGYFEKGDQQDALYVVNPDYTPGGSETAYTLHFSSEQVYQIWGTGGLEQIGTADEITLSLLPGDGKFVILNADNTIPQE